MEFEFEPIEFSQLRVGDLVKFSSHEMTYVSYCVIVKIGPSFGQNTEYYNNAMWGFWQDTPEKAMDDWKQHKNIDVDKYKGNYMAFGFNKPIKAKLERRIKRIPEPEKSPIKVDIVEV
jgi:hypothetical protein